MNRMTSTLPYYPGMLISADDFLGMLTPEDAALLCSLGDDSSPPVTRGILRIAVVRNGAQVPKRVLQQRWEGPYGYAWIDVPEFHCDGPQPPRTDR